MYGKLTAMMPASAPGIRTSALAMIVVSLSVAGCTTVASPSRGAKGLSSSIAAKPSTAATASSQLPPGLLPDPLAFPAAHFDGDNGWRAVVRGVGVILVAGRVFLDQPDGRAVPYGAIYTELDGDDPSAHPELQYRYTDPSPMGGYHVTGGEGALVHVRRDDGKSFIFDITTGHLRET